MDILVIVRLLWQRKWVIIGITVLGAVTAFLFTVNHVDKYKAVAQISTGFATPEQIQLTDERFNPRDAEIKFSNLLTAMNSGLVFNLLSYRLVGHDLKDEPFREPDPKVSVPSEDERKAAAALIEQKLQQLSPHASSDPSFELLKRFMDTWNYGFVYLRKVLAIKRIPNTDYIQIEFTSEDPDLSAFAANAYCEEFMRYYASLRAEQGSESTDFFKQLVDQKKNELDEKLEILKAFRSTNNILDIQQEGQVTLSQISDLENKRDGFRSKIQELELTTQRLKSDISNFGSSESSVKNNNQRIATLRGEISKLNEQYISKGDPSGILLDSLNSLRAQLQGLLDDQNNDFTLPNRGQALADLRSKLKDAEIQLQVEKTNLTQVEIKIRQLQYSVSGYASKDARVSAMQKEVDMASKEYTDAVERFNDAKNRSLASNTLRQVLIATPPVSPESARRAIVIALITFTSFALSVFTLVMIEILDSRIRTPEKFTSIVRLPLLGYVNEINIKSLDIQALFGAVSKNEEVEFFKSMLRKLRHEIVSLNAKTILFTSLKSGEGKTFLIFTLAYALSLINKKILIIDTNFRRNSLSQLLRPNEKLRMIDAHVGHSIALVTAGSKEKGYSEEDAENDKTRELINLTRFKNISIICNSGSKASPAEILGGKNFRELISFASQNYDFVFMEGASINDFSDTKELVENIDKVVCVFASQSVIKNVDRQSISYLKSLKDKFGGSILVRVDRKDLKL